MFYAEDIKAAMQVHLEKTLDEDGVFHLVDDVTGEALKLTFMQVHDPVRQMDGDVYFACTDFHPVGDEDRVYDIDFWLGLWMVNSRSFVPRFIKNPASRCSVGTNIQDIPLLATISNICTDLIERSPGPHGVTLPERRGRVLRPNG